MADLSPSERTRLKVLVGRLRKGILQPLEEHELRSLIGREYPREAVDYDQELLGLLGLGMMAVWHYFPDEVAETGAAS